MRIIGGNHHLVVVSSFLLLAVAAGPASPVLAAHHRPAPRPAARASGLEEEGGEAAAPAQTALEKIHVLENHPAPFALDARAAMLIEAHTGTVLYAFNEHQRMQPASLAKIMTFFITLDALKNGKIALDTMMPVSEKAWRLSMDQTVSKMFLEVGQQVAVRDLLYGLMVSSGNDSAMVLAEYLGGSEEGFVQLMNQKVQELGLAETHFLSPDGLPMPDQYTTASDMVKLARLISEQHPEAFTYTSLKDYTFHNIHQRNWNTLLFYDSRVNGLKTGHVAEAGFHLVATAHQNDLNLISAVMGARNAEKRRTETEKLLDWSFRSFINVKPEWHGLVQASVPVYKSAQRQVAIAPGNVPMYTVFRGEEKQIKVSSKVDVAYLAAPVSKGEPVGQLTISRAEQTIATVPIVTQSAIPRGSFLRVFADNMGLLFGGLGHAFGSAMRGLLGLVGLGKK